MSDIVISGNLASIPSLAEAQVAIANNVGAFGDPSNTPAEIKRVLEWFVDESCALRLNTVGSGKIHDSAACYSNGASLQVYGVIVDPVAGEVHGWIKYDLHLHHAPDPYVHLELFKKNDNLSQPVMKRHLRRAYESLVHVGVPKLTFEAGLQSGPTYWAYAGSEFVGGAPLLNHIRVLAAVLAGCDLAAIPPLNNPDDVRLLNLGATTSIEHAFNVSERISILATPNQVWVEPGQLAYKETELKLQIRDQMTIGEAILFALGPWNGVFDLTAPTISDVRFRRFLGLP